MLLNDKGYIVNAEGHFLVDQKGNNIKVELPKPLTPEELKARKKPTLLEANDPKLKDMAARITIDENGKIFDSGKLLALLKIQADTDKMRNLPELKMVVPIQAVIQRDAKTFNLIPNVAGKPQSELPPGQKEKLSIKQGFIEGSNIQIISEMIGLIHASKDYESGHKLIMSEDKILDKAINELGRTG
jgi:flagellar basal body rod protein FlgG